MLPAQEGPVKTVNLFYCYAPEDTQFQQQLRDHLRNLKNRRLLDDWEPRDLPPGQYTEQEITNRVNSAHLILLLVSSDFISSEHCVTITHRALERHRLNEARVLPILLRPVDLFEDQFSGIGMLPVGGKSVASWDNRDEAYTHITAKIRIVIDDLLGRRHVSDTFLEQPHSEQESQDFRPYRGLNPYTEHNARFFFGRNTYISDLLQKLLEDKRLLVVLGPTGSGKTSVIQAGVIPFLREGKILPRSSNWEILPFIPGEHPTSQLFSLLGVPDAKDIVEAITVWKQQHPKHGRLVIIIDPLEELFKLATSEEQQNFIKQCLKLIIYDLATIIMGMNDAYYGDLAAHADFIALAEPQISNIPELKSEEIREIIVKPAEVAGLYFEEHLVEKIVEDTMKSTKEPERRHRHSSVLPLVSTCLEQLCEKQKDHYMRLDVYNSLGQISGALTEFATNAFNDFNEQQQALARRILVDLVVPGNESEGRPDSRRQRSLTNFYRTQDEQKDIREVVEKLAQAHLLEVQRNEQTSEISVKLLHESLLREWGLLKDWVRTDRLFLLWHQEFELHLQKWLSSNTLLPQRDPVYLLRGRALLEAKEWEKERSNQLSNEAQNFILASVAFQEQEEQQAKTFQEMQIRQHNVFAQQLATKALLLQAQEPHSLRKSLLLAVEALRRYHSVEADQAVRYALAMLPCFLSRVNMNTGQTLLFSGDGCSLASAGKVGVSWTYHIRSDEQLAATLPLGETHAIALSYHGEYLLAGTYAGVAWFIDTINICRVAMIKYSAHIHCVALTRKEPYHAVIGYSDGAIKICQFIEENESIPPLSKAPLEQRMTVLFTISHGSAISSLSLSHNEQYLLSGGMDNIIRVWSKNDGSCLDAHNCKSPIRSALFSPDDTTIAIVTENGTAFVWQWEQKALRMWQRKKGQVLRIPQIEKIQSLTFSPDGTCLATASVDGFARIWNLQGMREATLFPHKGPVSALCYHQSEDWLVTASEDGNARVYGISDSILRQYIPHDTSVRAVALSSQKPYVATVDSRECVWIWQINNGTLPVRFSYSGKVIHLVFDQKSNNNALHLTIQESDMIKMRTLSLDSSLLNTAYAFQHAPSWIVANTKGELAIPDASTKIQVFSTDGLYRAEATFDGTVHVRGVQHYADKNTTYIKGNIEALVFSHNRAYLAIATREGHLFLWKWEEKDLIPISLPSEINSLQSLLFSGDDEDLIMVANENEVFTRHWMLQTERIHASFRQESAIHAISLCPNTWYLLTIGKEKKASIWDMTTGLPVQNIPQKGEIIAAAFDREGKYLALASSDYTVGLWDVYTGKQCASLKHDRNVYAIAFSNDTRYLATVCEDSILRIWLWKQEDLEAEAKLRLIGNLTSEEWQEYLGHEPYQETFKDLGWRDLS